MRLTRKAQEQADDGLPLTSLIDVVFLLLIFFMVTSSMAISESQLLSALQMEKAGAGRASDLAPQVVNVEVRDGAPVFRLGDRVITTKHELTAILAGLPKESGVFVRVSGAAPVEAAAAALQAVKDAGFTRVSYVPAE